MVGQVEGIRYDRLCADLVPAVCALMEEVQATVAGMVEAGIFRAVAQDALDGKQMTMVVAERGGEVVGFVAAVTDWHRYWRLFALRYPWWGARILARRLRRCIRPVRRARNATKAAAAPVDEYLSDSSSGRSWGNSGPHIAKIVFIGVSPRWRGRRVGSILYDRLFRLLAQCGVRRVDACIGAANIASVRMHHRAGWRIERDRSGFFATIDIAEQQGDASNAPLRTDRV